MPRFLRLPWSWHRRHPTGGKIREIFQTHTYYNDTGEEIMATPAGGTSTFQFNPTPAGSAFPAGTTFTWTVDDTADITLTQNGLQCTAACATTPAGTSYNLTCTSNFTPPAATGPVAATINVAIVATVVPTPTGATITQLS